MDLYLPMTFLACELNTMAEKLRYADCFFLDGRGRGGVVGLWFQNTGCTFGSPLDSHTSKDKVPILVH